MKKIISCFLSIVLIFSVCSFPVSAQFENVDKENFDAASEKVEISNNSFFYVARPQDGADVNSAAAYGALMCDTTKNTKVKIKFDTLYKCNVVYEMDFRLEGKLSQNANAVKLVRFEKDNTESGLITLWNSKDDGFEVRVCGRKEDGTMTYPTSGNAKGRLKYKTWHHLRVEINTENNTYSVYVDDYPVKLNLTSYRNSFADGINNVLIYTDSAIDNALLIDNISIKRDLSVTTDAYCISGDKIYIDSENITSETFLSNIQLPVYSIAAVYSDYATKTLRTGNIENGDTLALVSETDSTNVKLYTIIIPKYGTTYYVSPQGSDLNDGLTVKTAFASINQAKNAVHLAKKKQPDSAYTVNILPGEYQMKEPVVFTSADSGSAQYPVIYKRYGAGEVVFKGSKIIEKAEPAENKEIVNAVLSAEAKSNLMQIDLKAEGIKIPYMPDNYGYGAGGEYIPLRVYINGRTLTEARYPNEGDLMIPVKTVNNATTYKTDGCFDLEYYDNDAPYARTSLWNQTDRDIFIAGVIAPQWGYNHMRLKSFDPANKNMVTKSYKSDVPAIGRSYFWFTNILEEIDVPGESYLDEESGILYFYPYEDMTDAKIEVCTFDTEMLQLNDADYITFKNLNFEYSGRKILHAENSDYLTIDGCVMAHTAENAMKINGHHTTITNCHIYDLAGMLGTGGIHLTGSGDRESLTSGESRIVNNRIHDTDVIYQVSQSPAIYILDSVGTEISNNEIYNGTAYVVRITDCNDIVFKQNEVYNAVTMSSDAGALTWGRDITLMGFKVIENYFHDIGNDIGIREQETTGQICLRTGQQGLFHDDGSSGPYAYGNIFYQPKANDTRNKYFSIKANGGQYGVWENNIFIGGDTAAYFGAWRTGYTKYNGDNNVQDMWWLRNYNVYDLDRDADGQGGSAIYWDRISNPDINFFENEVWKEKYKDQYGAYWTLFTKEQKQTLEEAYDPTLGNIKKNQALLDAAAAHGEALFHTNVIKNNIMIDTMTPIEYIDTANYREAEGSKTGIYTAQQGEKLFVDYGTDFNLTAEGLLEIQKSVPAFKAIDFDAIGYKEPEKKVGFEVKDVKLENAKVSLLVHNVSDFVYSGILVVLAYDGEQLSDIKFITVTDLEEQQEQRMQDIEVNAAADSIKVYMLKDFFSMQILSNIIEK